MVQRAESFKFAGTRTTINTVLLSVVFELEDMPHEICHTTHNRGRHDLVQGRVPNTELEAEVFVSPAIHATNHLPDL